MSMDKKDNDFNKIKDTNHMISLLMMSIESQSNF
jgi:hypothetical protein